MGAVAAGPPGAMDGGDNAVRRGAGRGGAGRGARGASARSAGRRRVSGDDISDSLKDRNLLAPSRVSVLAARFGRSCQARSHHPWQKLRGHDGKGRFVP